MGPSGISIPAPPRGASPHRFLRCDHIDFNTSPSTRGFPTPLSVMRSYRFQYQPLHEGLPGRADDIAGVSISIPAPPRGASVTATDFAPDDISIPAPPRGASTSQIRFPRLTYFNTSPSTRGFQSSRKAATRAAFQYQPLHEGLLRLVICSTPRWNFNTSPSTRGFSAAAS